MPAKPRWLLAIPDAIQQLEQLDQDLLTRRDLERLFGVSKVRATQLMTAFGAGRTGPLLTLPRAAGRARAAAADRRRGARGGGETTTSASRRWSRGETWPAAGARCEHERRRRAGRADGPRAHGAARGPRAAAADRRRGARGGGEVSRVPRRADRGARARRTGGPWGSSWHARPGAHGGLPLHVAAYIRTHPGSAPTVKQHLAAIRMLGDWLVVSQVLPVNPAAAVRGPTHVVTTGATPVLAPAEARRLLEAIDPGTLAGRRDRALVSVMLYSFARVSAVIGMRRHDYFRQERQGWLRLHEKGGTRHDVPAHHRAAEALDDYLAAAGRDEPTAALFQSVDPRGAAADGPGALAASRPGHDQAAGGGGGSPALDLLPHVPGDGDHGVSVQWRDARTRAADRRARLPEDDEALRPDGGHDHRRRDRAHRDLGGGRTARRRAPRDVRRRRDGRAARGRVRHGGVRVGEDAR